MSPTVRGVLACPVVRRADPRVLTGEAALDRAVRWVHVGEVADVTDLLSGGELILTTGLPLRADPAGWVAGLAAAGAVGLVVELGDALPAVPPAAVHAAEDHDLPLIALGRRVRFVEITEQVHREIVAGQVADLEFGRTVHEVFTALSLEGADPGRIVAAAADLGAAPVVLEDLTRYVVAHAGRGTPAATLLARWEDRSRLAPVLTATGRTGPEGWTTVPVGTAGGIWGRLVALPGAPDDGAARLPVVLERAAQALELSRMTERDRSGVLLQAQSGLLRELADGDPVTEDDARARARALGTGDAPAYVAVVVHDGRHDPRSAPRPDDPVTEQGRARRLLDRVASAARECGLPVLLAPLRAHQVAMLLALPRPDAAGPERVLDRLAAALPEPFLLGVAEPDPGLVAAGRRIPLAQHVAESAAARHRVAGERRWFRGADVRLHGLLAQLHDDPRLQRFAEAELGALLAHDAAHGTDLLALLRAYVDAGGNKTVLARGLHQSRTALYKRLARLERVLGVPLDDPTSLLSLGVAVLAYDHARTRAPRPLSR